MLRLLLARHGQTDWNAQHRYQGHAPVPLNETGRRQAAALGQRLAHEGIEAIYSSDLPRAWMTAQAVADGVQPAGTSRAAPARDGLWRVARTHARRGPRPPAAAPPGGLPGTALFCAYRRRNLGPVGRAHRLGPGAGTPHAAGQDRAVGDARRSAAHAALPGAGPRTWSKTANFRTHTASVSELHVFQDRTLLALLNDTHHL